MNIPLRQYWELLYRYMRPQWARVLLLVGLLFGGIGLQLANPQNIRYFIDTAEAGGSERALLGAAGLFLLFAAGRQVLAIGATFVGERVGWRATNKLRSDLALHILRLDMPFHKCHTPGELIERIDGDVSELAGFFSKLVILVMGSALLILGILVLLFLEDWRLGAGAALYAGLVLAILQGTQKWAVRVWSGARQARAELFGFLEERLGGTEDIRSSGAEAYVMRRFYLLMRNLLDRDRRAALLSGATFAGTHFVYVLSYSLGLAVGVFLFSRGLTTVGGVYLIVYYIGLLEGPLNELRHHVQELQQAAASIGRVAELFRCQPVVQDPTTAAEGLVRPAGALAVEFRDVSFAYDDAEAGDNGLAVLQELGFRLEPGRVLGLLGRTGSGKTTLTRLLFRLYDPSHGRICLDDVNIRRLLLEELRDRVGMVTQDVQLFQASVRDNLTFFRREIGDEEIWRVVAELGLDGWLRSLPDGLDTRLGSGGGLSAGEAQLLAFARVFLKDPGLVVLDEASSRLDPATERLLERAIDRLLERRTGIIIAHRLATVQRADDILILENGRSIEYGPRTELARDRQSRFSRLLQTGLEEALA